MKEEKRNEASVHFELYRLIKNNMDKCNSEKLSYKEVEPEYTVGTGAVDLLIYAEVDNQIKPFLPIEVKKPTYRSYLLYDDKSVKQIKKYAGILSSSYFALTDGNILRLFSPAGTRNYQMRLTDGYVISLLKGLSGFGDQSLQNLSIPAAPKYDKEALKSELEETARTLTNIFKQLGQKEGFKIRFEEKRTSHMLKLSFNSFKDVLHLAVEREKSLRKDVSYIGVKLSDFRRTIGCDALRELLVKLKQVQYFQWVEPNKSFGTEWIISKNLIDASTEEKSEPAKLEKDLTDWFLSVSKITMNT